MEQPQVSWGAPHAERADAARNRAHLLATARQVLAEQSADQLTMDALAERAGLGKGTVFRRFGAARAALDGHHPIPAGSQTPMSQVHIRVLLGQIDLGGAYLDTLAAPVLAAALTAPATMSGNGVNHG